MIDKVYTIDQQPCRDSRLFEAAIDCNKPLLQFVDGVHFLMVYTTLCESPDLV